MMIRRIAVPDAVLPKQIGGTCGMLPLRHELGDVLRAARLHRGRTLREVSATALVSLGYLSEVERGRKEASSELLASICDALDVPLWAVLREVADRMALADGVHIPDSVPDDLAESFGHEATKALAAV